MNQDDPTAALARMIEATSAILELAEAGRRFFDAPHAFWPGWNAAVADHTRRRDLFIRWRNLQYQIVAPGLDSERHATITQELEHLRQEAGAVPLEPVWAPPACDAWSNYRAQAFALAASVKSLEIPALGCVCRIDGLTAGEIETRLDALAKGVQHLADYYPIDKFPHQHLQSDKGDAERNYLWSEAMSQLDARTSYVRSRLDGVRKLSAMCQVQAAPKPTDRQRHQAKRPAMSRAVGRKKRDRRPSKDRMNAIVGAILNAGRPLKAEEIRMALRDKAVGTIRHQLAWMVQEKRLSKDGHGYQPCDQPVSKK